MLKTRSTRKANVTSPNNESLENEQINNESVLYRANTICAIMKTDIKDKFCFVKVVYYSKCKNNLIAP